MNSKKIIEYNSQLLTQPYKIHLNDYHNDASRKTSLTKKSANRTGVQCAHTRIHSREYPEYLTQRKLWFLWSVKQNYVLCKNSHIGTSTLYVYYTQALVSPIWTNNTVRFSLIVCSGWVHLYMHSNRIESLVKDIKNKKMSGSVYPLCYDAYRICRHIGVDDCRRNEEFCQTHHAHAPIYSIKRPRQGLLREKIRR